MRREQNLCIVPENDYQAFVPSTNNYIDLAVALLTHYSFDLGGYIAREIVWRWQKQFPANWLHLAAIEALYQGRYKAFSVEQILTMWQRRGQASFHFNMEFECLICRKFPESLITSPSSPRLPQITATDSGGKLETQTATVETLKLTTNIETTENTTVKTLKGITHTGIPHIKIENDENQSRINTQLSKLLPPATIHSPIQQFIPEESDRADAFASKLKAIVGS
ncbi:hypothetical protein [Calothrix sp. PCC 6303]|uniref:hypothetical protein n=1 Tax=Calothrix sp. PCC 6303 TaxID=1170562 RepID=UPI0002A0033F|nr:hypothetical protein [Calothrix sp. PCC 6303]AFZ04123.1 hypothetical protein Cal6303_5237 [Calothrix sp. PCC 6303]